MFTLVLYFDVVLIAISGRCGKAVITRAQCFFPGLMIPEIDNLLLKKVHFVPKLPVFIDEPGNFVDHFAGLIVACSCPV